MSQKEKILISYLGLLVSLVIFIGIIFYTIDLEGIKVKLLGDKMMTYLSQNEYEKFYDNYSSNNLSDLNDLTEYLDNVNESLGYMKKYRYTDINKNKVNGEEDRISIDYNVNFSKFPDEDTKVTLVCMNSNNKLKVSECKIVPKTSDIISELSTNINKINSSIKTEESKKVDDSKKFVNEVLEAYQKADYKYIYSIASSNLKEKGNEKEFIDYLQKQHNKYGQINNIKLNKYEISKDKSEYKLEYYADDNKKAFITFWVTIKDKLYLSGIKISESVW